MPQLPPTTKALMLLCTALFCVQMLVGRWLEGWLALWPLASGNFMPWQLITYAFLHGDMAHLFFNMLGMWMFGSELERLPGPGGLENLRTLAIARLMLDNFPHVKAFWIMQTLPMAQLMLGSGADDIDGTVVWYDITKVNHGSGQGSQGDGVKTHQEVNVWTLQKAIREAGFEPVERDTLYRRVVRDAADGRKWSVASPRI